MAIDTLYQTVTKVMDGAQPLDGDALRRDLGALARSWTGDKSTLRKAALEVLRAAFTSAREQVKGVGLGSLCKHQRVSRDVDVFQYAHQAGDINPGEGSEKRYPTQERFDGVGRREMVF